MRHGVLSLLERSAAPGLMAVLAVTALAVLGGCTPPAVQKAGDPDAADSRAALRDEWGVEITGVRISAAGYIVDFRYRVHDAGKSKALFVRKTKPVLVQQSSGRELQLYRSPKVGPMRSSYQPKEDRVYTILFANSGRIVVPGDRVTVKIGDFIVEDLVVE